MVGQLGCGCETTVAAVIISNLSDIGPSITSNGRLRVVLLAGSLRSHLAAAGEGTHSPHVRARLQSHTICQTVYTSMPSARPRCTYIGAGIQSRIRGVECALRCVKVDAAKCYRLVPMPSPVPIHGGCATTLRHAHGVHCFVSSIAHRALVNLVSASRSVVDRVVGGVWDTCDKIR